jgi:CubicO group peptidase (beta-lactamase class C family)
LGRALSGTTGGHDAQGAALPGGHHRYPELAAAGLWTTPSDDARFLIALQNGADGVRRALVTRARWQAITTPVRADYGLGVSVLARGGRTMIAHRGSNAGFQCGFLAFINGRARAGGDDQ